jgi:DnaJ-like protein
VPPTATAEQIVTAYRLRSKILHPDRLDPQKQRAEWDLANEMLKDLNQAYATLRDAAAREAYDCNINVSRVSAGSDAASRPSARPPPPQRRASILPNLVAGHALFTSLPVRLQQRLIERRRGKNRQQFTTAIGRVGLVAYLATAGCVVFFGNLIFNSATQRWDSETRGGYLSWAIVAALGLAWGVFRILRFYRSPLKRRIIVTPLYFIETRHDELWYWPIWHVRGTQAINRYYNSVYFGTDVTVTFPTEERCYRIRPQKAYTNLVEAFDVFREKIIQADAQLDRQYFREEDDFTDVSQKSSPPRTAKKVRLPIAAAVLASLMAGAATMLAFALNENAPEARPVRLGTTQMGSGAGRSPSGFDFGSTNAARRPTDFASQSYDRSKDPPNGFIYKNLLRAGYGTLRIQNGTAYHAVVKLVNTQMGRSVFTVFIGAGEEFTIRNIPDGSYKLAFASGRRWNWLADGFNERKGSSVFHDDILFDTSYEREVGGIRTYYHEFEVTLQPVVNGNARAEALAPDVFAGW